MKILVNNALVHIDYVDPLISRSRKDYTVKFVRSTNLAKKMYRGSIFGEKDGMLEIRTPKDNIYKVPITGHYMINDHLFYLGKEDIVEVLGCDYINIQRIN